jgi:hypothetical protein
MATDRAAVILDLYSRRCCHLCDDMIAALSALQGRFGFELRVVDVDGDPALERRYGEHVPLLAHAGRELCRHVLDAAAVTAYLAEIR